MMFWLGLLLGVALTAPFAFERQAWRGLPPLAKARRVAVRTQDETWEQTRNFLYYDGTVMPTKEEGYE